MRIVVVKFPKALCGIMRRIFGISGWGHIPASMVI